MKIKNIMIVTFLLFVIMTIGTVNATDDNSTTDALTWEDDKNDLQMEYENNEILDSNDSNDIISDWEIM